MHLDHFSQPVADLLRKYSDRVIPLTRGGPCERSYADLLSSPTSLFPEARDAHGALSGLLLLLGCWNESHQAAQDDASREGSYWHAIVHRMEPDAWNSGYWFRRVGAHPIFTELHQRASEILSTRSAVGWHLKSSWDPSLFIDWCDDARRHPNTEKETVALDIQRAEWELLFRWCALAPERA